MLSGRDIRCCGGKTPGESAARRKEKVYDLFYSACHARRERFQALDNYSLYLYSMHLSLRHQDCATIIVLHLEVAVELRQSLVSHFSHCTP